MAEKRLMFRRVRLGADQITLDLTKRYGLVLEGGGAKGAFQIGAWKALREAGVKLGGVSGVSVGALNGALICMDDLEQAEEIWSSMDSEAVMDLGTDPVEGLLHLIRDRGLNISPLKKLIQETVDEERIRNSDCELYATTFSLSDKKLLNIDVKTMPEGEIKDILLASAYLPVFKPEKLGGKLYTDGGGFNNVPLDVLVERDYKDIIVVRIYGIGLDRERRVKLSDDTKVYHIAPREDLGGILEFDKKRSRKNMVLGYLEAQRLLYGLAGKHYYIHAPHSEAYYFNKLMSKGWLPAFYLKGEAPEENRGYRYYTEEIFPRQAKRLKLSANWDYRELYLRLLEELAVELKIFRYRVYTEGEFSGEIYRALIRNNTLTSV